MSQPRGTGTRRSKACWTCTLRHKGCEGGKPSCKVCLDRSITCWGYSADRPHWMDGGDLQRAELTRTQRGVKDNTARQNRLRKEEERRRNSEPNSATQQTVSGNRIGVDMLITHHDLSRPNPIEADSYSSEAGENSQGYGRVHHEISSTESPSRPSTPVSPNLAGVSLTTRDVVETPPSSTPSHFGYSHHREYELLMHYLDKVFALQFRFHVPSVNSGGRGWLLWLLTETKPLKHAALSLGALHQHSLLGRPERHDTLMELNEHNTRALRELQIFLQNEYETSNAPNRSRKHNLQVLACGVQFISFELFRGGINFWDLHLRCLATWLSQTYKDQEWIKAIGSPTAVSSPNGSHRIEDTAEQFLTGAILWFDILACASTGNAPLTKDSHYSLLRSGNIDLANISGCQVWVALLISDIAQIQEERRRNTLSTWELEHRGNPIRQELMSGIALLRRQIDEALSTQGPVNIMLNTASHAEAVNRAVTLAFAYATQVYLHTTVTGAYPYHQEIKTSVQDTANALKEMRNVCDLQASRSLVWPICIAGSMAESPELQNFFRSLIVDLGEQAHGFGNSVTVLRIMEKCWSHWPSRGPGHERMGYSWLSAMEANDQRVLLV